MSLAASWSEPVVADFFFSMRPDPRTRDWAMEEQGAQELPFDFEFNGAYALEYA